VHTDGSISDVKPLTNHGYGMENGAKRLIENGPVWVPAKQNGHLVNAYLQQPVTFQVEDKSNPVTITNPVTNTSLNTFYTGVQNRITIQSTDIKPEKLFENISAGSIQGSNGR